MFETKTLFPIFLLGLYSNSLRDLTHGRPQIFQTMNSVRSVAEFKEFERRFKYGGFHLQLYQMFQDLSRRLI